jgi:hypothetical protein
MHIYIHARNDAIKYVVLGIHELAPSRMSSYTNMMLHGFIRKMEVCWTRSLALDPTDYLDFIRPAFTNTVNADVVLDRATQAR